MKIPPSLLLILFSLFTVTLFSCKDKVNDIIPVPSYLRNMIPYRDGQMITFTSSDNKKIITKIEVKESIENCTSCVPNEKRQVLDYVLHNTEHVTYTTVAKLQIIDRAENYVFMSVFSPIDDFMNGTGFDFKTIDKTSAFFSDNSNFFLHNSINIGSLTYKNVLEIKVISDLPRNHLTTVYYSKEKGIIRFDYRDGQQYTLDE